MKRTEVLAVVSEIYPLIKTGGLADVAGALPAALKPEGFAVRTLVPGYPAVIKRLRKAEPVHAFDAFFGGEARLLASRTAGLDLLVLDAPHLYARPGGPYAGSDGADWPDNAVRFAALARAGASLGQGLLPDYRPQIVHAHDWQAGLTAAYLHYDNLQGKGGPRPGTVITVHNLAFQGQFDRRLLASLDLPATSFTPEGVEYYGDIGFLKAGLKLADRVTTVSPTYAREIRTPDGGMGLDGLLISRGDRVSGIINGIDIKVWDPSTDRLIETTYDASDPAPRTRNKADLQARFGLDPDPGALLFGVVSRLSWQKGLDLLLETVPALVAEGAQLALIGTGDAALEAGFGAAMSAHPGRIGCVFGYDEALAHRIQAGVDALLVPSRFEPCGLTQLCALRYGAVPVVSRVGGLNDTVIDAEANGGTGVQFSPVDEPALEGAIRRAARLYRDPDRWRRLQANGMAADVSWRLPARSYAELYRALIAERAG